MIPRAAWRRPIGQPCPDVGHPRVEMPMIDDGEWAGVPIGGMGAGSIGRTFRGDFARWHLEIGRHRFEPVPACAFSVFVESGSGRGAHVLSTLRPDSLRSWSWDMPVGAGTYHALFPYAWFEYDWAALPVRIVQRQFSPVIPGDYRSSSLPVGLFEFEVDNPGPDPVTVGIMFSWAADAERSAVRRDDGALGLEFASTDQFGKRTTFAIAAGEAAGEAAGARSTFRRDFSADDGAAVWADFAADGRLDDVDDGAPYAASQPLAGAIASTVHIGSGESATVPFALAWDIPIASFESGRRWYRRYTRHVGRSGDNAWPIARDGLRDRVSWSTAIDGWQAPILADPERPDWYKAALFNELYFVLDGGTLWTDGPALADEAAGTSEAEPEIGRFALLECFDYPFYNTLDVNFYASYALLRLWPELEREVIRSFVASVDVEQAEVVDILWSGKRAASKVRGAVPHDVGGPDGDPFVELNQYRFQDPNVWKDLNSKFVLQVWRDAVLLRDEALVRDAWPAAATAMERLAAFDRDGDGLPEHDEEPDQTYDAWPMRGPSAYTGALWLAALRASLEMAGIIGDEAARARWGEALARATRAYDEKLWTGSYYRYDGSDGAGSESVMADQLAGQWYADVCGLGDLVPPGRVEAALSTVYDRNVVGFMGGGMGAVNGTAADGGIDESSEQSAEVWVGTTYALAAFMIGRGMVEQGWRTAQGAAAITYERGLWFRTPEAYDRNGNFRASMYLRPLAIWAIEEALERVRGGGAAAA